MSLIQRESVDILICLDGSILVKHGVGLLLTTRIWRQISKSGQWDMCTL